MKFARHGAQNASINHLEPPVDRKDSQKLISKSSELVSVLGFEASNLSDDLSQAYPNLGLAPTDVISPKVTSVKETEIHQILDVFWMESR